MPHVIQLYLVDDPSSALRARATVSLDGIVIHGVRYVKGAHGPFVSPPSRRDADGKWWPHIEWDAETGAVILEAIEQAMDR